MNHGTRGQCDVWFVFEIHSKHDVTGCTGGIEGDGTKDDIGVGVNVVGVIFAIVVGIIGIGDNFFRNNGTIGSIVGTSVAIESNGKVLECIPNG